MTDIVATQRDTVRQSLHTDKIMAIYHSLAARVPAVAVDTGTCQATLFRWKRQALIDAGVVEGVPSVQADELAAHKPIAALEAELALTRDACELFDEQAVVPQNADARSLKG